MASKLWYRGPKIDQLHDGYAKRGRIDEQAPIQATYEVDIAAPMDTVWALLSDPTTWAAWDRHIHDVTVTGPTAVDVRFVWSSGRSRMRSRFAVVEPGREITWTGVSSGAKAVHRHLLESRAGDVTHVRCEESMAGTLLGLFSNRDKLHDTLRDWLHALKTAAESENVSV